MTLHSNHFEEHAKNGPRASPRHLHPTHRYIPTRVSVFFHRCLSSLLLSLLLSLLVVSLLSFGGATQFNRNQADFSGGGISVRGGDVT